MPTGFDLRRRTRRSEAQRSRQQEYEVKPEDVIAKLTSADRSRSPSGRSRDGTTHRVDRPGAPRRNVLCGPRDRARTPSKRERGNHRTDRPSARVRLSTALKAARGAAWQDISMRSTLPGPRAYSARTCDLRRRACLSVRPSASRRQYRPRFQLRPLRRHLVLRGTTLTVASTHRPDVAGRTVTVAKYSTHNYQWWSPI